MYFLSVGHACFFIADIVFGEPNEQGNAGEVAQGKLQAKNCTFIEL